MLTDFLRGRSPKWQHTEQVSMTKSIRYSMGSITSAIRSVTHSQSLSRGFTRVRVPVCGLTLLGVQIHPAYVEYAPIAVPDAAKSLLWHAIFGTWTGKIILGLIAVVTVAAVVVGIVVPIELSKTSASDKSALQATNESESFFINFNVSNSSLTPGNITDARSLAVVQAQLDNITTIYSSQLSPCRLQLLYAEATTDSHVIACSSLECGVTCTETCFKQKSGLLTTIIEANKESFTIQDFSDTSASNTSRRLARSILPPEQDEKVDPGTIIDGRAVVGTNGIVVSVSFYIDQSCIGHSIQFGAFEMNDHEGEQAEFTVAAGSGPLIVSQTEFLSSSSDNKMKLISIPLCPNTNNNNNDDTSIGLSCQGVQFPIKIQQYFGSFSTHCSLGSTTLEKVDDAYTYANRNDGDSFNGPLRRLRYTSLGKKDVLQVPTITASDAENNKYRTQQITMGSPVRVVFLGTYPPRGCGLATFLHDVVVNYDEHFNTNSSVIAIDEKGTAIDRVYPSRVIARLNQTERDSHLNIAKFINELNNVDVLNIQHEFGLFGGQAGEWVLHLIATVKKPVLVTFHTVLRDPASIYYSITRAICSSATGIIVLSNAGRDILVKVYQIDVSKIHVVPHGIPNVPFQETLITKRKLDLSNRVTMATFGLIGRSKGLEYAIRAMKLAVAQVPNLVYIILGATHPVIVKEVGEEYRIGLQAMINNLSLSDNVKLVNKYLDKTELLTYLNAVDIYLTPYPNPDQVVSGTLSIAVGCGKAVISTPYIYAQELLAHGRGFLVPFTDDALLSQTIVRVATDTELRDSASRRAYKYGRKMVCSRVVVELARIHQNALLDM